MTAHCIRELISVCEMAVAYGYSQPRNYRSKLVQAAAAALAEVRREAIPTVQSPASPQDPDPGTQGGHS